MISDVFYRITKFILFVFFKILFRLQVFGKNNFPSVGGFIVAANHLSYLDPVVVGISSPRNLHYLAREDLFGNKVFGFLLSHLGAIPLKRDSTKDIGALKKAFSLLAKKKGVCVFPEGARSLSGKLQKLQAGIGLLAIKSRCPVVPVLIVGTDKALPVKAKFIKLEKVIAYVGKPIFPPQVSDDHEDFENFTHKIEDSLKELEYRVKNFNKLEDTTKKNNRA